MMMLQLKSKKLKNYFGGKKGTGTYQFIINHIPPHDIYIDGFIGGGGILVHKKKAKQNIINDISPKIIDLWRNEEIEWIEIFNQDIFDFLELFSNNTKLTFLYLDPPYPFSTRKSQKKIYDYEMTDEQHRKLISIVIKLKCNVAISCYENEIYDTLLLMGWNKLPYKNLTRQGITTEHLYFNYPIPKELHDYSFLGHNYRQRHRINKKIKREVNKLKRLPILERNAILDKLKNEF